MAVLNWREGHQPLQLSLKHLIHVIFILPPCPSLELPLNKVLNKMNTNIKSLTTSQPCDFENNFRFVSHRLASSRQVKQRLFPKAKSPVSERSEAEKAQNKDTIWVNKIRPRQQGQKIIVGFTGTFWYAQIPNYEKTIRKKGGVRYFLWVKGLVKECYY